MKRPGDVLERNVVTIVGLLAYAFILLGTVRVVEGNWSGALLLMLGVVAAVIDWFLCKDYEARPYRRIKP